ncbi:hypothetical protein SVIO_093320 [Streptomyces violaceusniger]|uniref:Uncharacterized protein n=1 Tax=Streptomyces violaceusniger TaxID=68280 RepID=A0A4D4LLE8_STRVO|nr:hypothetical protein SVIO_093320 [Streptomyces violaceusniger]
MKNSRVALAFVSGYLFGRGHRGTLVLGLAGLAAGKRLSSGISPPGAQQLKSSELGRLGQEIGGRLVSAGREAAMSAASHRMDALSDRLERRAETLRTGGAGAGDRRPGSTRSRRSTKSVGSAGSAASASAGAPHGPARAGRVSAPADSANRPTARRRPGSGPAPKGPRGEARGEGHDRGHQGADRWAGRARGSAH